MDADKVQEQTKVFVDHFNSVDPEDMLSNVDRFFAPNAVFENTHILAHGSGNVRKLFDLGRYARASKGKITQGPEYDEKNKVFRFSNSLDYAYPNIPGLAGRKAVVNWTWTAQLAAPSSKKMDGQKLYVTRLVGEQKGARSGILPQALYRAIVTFVCLALATVLIFARNHKGENPIQLALSAATEIFNAVWAALLGESSKRQAQVEQWRSEKGPQLKEYYNQAYSQASQAYSQAFEISAKVQTDIENRAKSAGIPVDDYKQRATQAVSDLAENLESRAKAAGLPVEEYKKQAEALIEDLKKRAGEVAGYVDEQTQQAQKAAKDTAEDAAKKASQVKRSAEKKADELTQDNTSETRVNGQQERTETDPEQRAKEIRAEFAATPRTPLGGHDPTALGAPSFAEAAAEH